MQQLGDGGWWSAPPDEQQDRRWCHAGHQQQFNIAEGNGGTRDHADRSDHNNQRAPRADNLQTRNVPQHALYSFLTESNYFSTHSTNAPGTSLRTTMTRRTRSSRRSSAAPVRAASTEAYRAQACGIPEADPRLIVVTSLNIPVNVIAVGVRADVSDCTPPSRRHFSSTWSSTSFSR